MKLSIIHYKIIHSLPLWGLGGFSLWGMGGFFALGGLLLFSGCYKEESIAIDTKFTVAYKNSDESVPVVMQITNQTTGADTFEWTFEGGIPATSTDKSPAEITYATPGTYTIKLKTSNVDGETGYYEQTFTAKTGIDIKYSTKIINSQYPPVEVQITNETAGENLTYDWEFQGGNPATFSGKSPPNVLFTEPGNHTVKVKVSNGFESFTKQSTIEVLENRKADFSWTVSFDDQDYQAPVTMNLVNQSVSATSYQWTINGGTPNASTEANPSVIFSAPGTYNISLTATNDKGSSTTTKTVVILPDTNLRVFKDLKFGINAAFNNNAYGAFFSTETGNLYTASNTPLLGNTIDIVYFGLNSTGSFNKFISPDNVSSFGFLPITGATHTKFINSQELCGCGINFTVTDFNNMTNATPLQALTITETAGGLQEFDKSSLPRVVIFQNQEGRKGAILVKEFVQDGVNSYIVVDIKVMKSP